MEQVGPPARGGAQATVETERASMAKMPGRLIEAWSRREAKAAPGLVEAEAEEVRAAGPAKVGGGEGAKGLRTRARAAGRMHNTQVPQWGTRAARGDGRGGRTDIALRNHVDTQSIRTNPVSCWNQRAAPACRVAGAKRARLSPGPGM